MKNRDLTQGSVMKALIYFAIPFILANILQSLYGAVDLYVIGRFCPVESVAAVSTGTQVTQIVTSLAAGLTLGATVLIGQYTGAKDFERVKRTIGTALTSFAVFAVIISALLLIFERPLLHLLQAPAESFELTMTYVAICACGTVFICGYNAISAVLRGYGDSKRPMMFVGIACVMNIILDFFFVGALHMGVAGTAVATVISQASSMFIAVAYLRRHNFLFDFRPRSFIPDKTLVRHLLRVGVPISLQELMVRISFLYLMVIMNRCGVHAVSIIGIGAKFDVFSMLAGTSLASATAAITAQNLGAGKPERARRSLIYAIIVAASIAAVFFLWAQISPESMIGVFTDDAETVRIGAPYFRACSYDYIFVALVFIMNGYLNGCQKTLWTMGSNTFSALCLRIPGIWYVGAHFPTDLGKLGTVAPMVTGIMAVYTAAYLIWTAHRRKNREAL